MKYFFLLIFFLLIMMGVASFQSKAQTWADDIAPIMYDNCVLCHHDGGVAPFPLMSFMDAYNNAFLIEHVVQSGEMPPWPADPNYRHFSGETILTAAEKQAIYDWVAGGRPEGNPADAPTPPTFQPSGSVLQQIDFTAQIQDYTLQYNTDEYRWFVIPTSFPDTVYIERIETIPGLNNVVHHADISYDMTGLSAALDAADPLPGFNNMTGGPNYSYYMNAWAPGAGVAKYPDNWGIALPPGADLVVEIHYGPGGIGQVDTTKFNLQFIDPPNPSVRPVKVGFLLGQTAANVIDGPIYLTANTIQTYHQVSAPLASPMSAIAIAPHMHFLGKSYEVWAVTPAMDTVNLCYIPQWDFHWQRYYFFPIIQTLPAGTILYSEGVYDNTVFNADNPNVPPIDVTIGPNTTDEMFLTYFIYADYEPGDENIIMDSTMAYVGLDQLSQKTGSSVYPNPTTTELNILFLEPMKGVVDVEIYSMEGRLVKSVQINNAGQYQLSLDVQDLDKGMYAIKYLNQGEFNSVVFLKN